MVCNSYKMQAFSLRSRVLAGVAWVCAFLASLGCGGYEFEIPALQEDRKFKVILGYIL